MAMSQLYDDLLAFISDKRKMPIQHIYRSVMLMTLLNNGGKAIASNSSRYVSQGRITVWLLLPRYKSDTHQSSK